MALFGKREKVFEVWGDAPRWKAARAALKQQGIKIMESGFYDTEAPVCGCGASWTTGTSVPTAALTATPITSASGRRTFRGQRPCWTSCKSPAPVHQAQ